MRVLLCTTQVPFTRGGAELLAEELVKALRQAGHDAEIVAIPFKWYPPERVPEHILACRLLDVTESSGIPVDLVIGLKFPAYFVRHPSKVLWILHQHRTAYDLWDNYPLGDLIHYPEGREVRDAIQHCDERFLPEARAIYTISGNVSKRLKSFCGIDSRPLYHPPRNAGAFRAGDAGDYLSFPSRMNIPKRQELVLQALAKTRTPVKVTFSGRSDIPSYAEELKLKTVNLGLADRVTWKGETSDEMLVDLYAHCLGVVYPPIDEDYGYVTLEAMLASKPVITCRDSGGALEFVAHGETGLCAEPAPEALASAMDELWDDRARAARMGQAGRARYEALVPGWPEVVARLLG
ncbi:MAG: glycosyltransferase family 4 protein [Acidobacteriota bacterium]